MPYQDLPTMPKDEEGRFTLIGTFESNGRYAWRCNTCGYVSGKIGVICHVCKPVKPRKGGLRPKLHVGDSIRPLAPDDSQETPQNDSEGQSKALETALCPKCGAQGTLKPHRIEGHLKCTSCRTASKIGDCEGIEQ